jgi:NADH:ubiquinone reductase (H+-translocating)
MATIGHKAAVADAFGRKVTGLSAYLMWGMVHVAYLIGWGNRIGVLYTWARALYLSHDRGHRIISFDITRHEIAGQRTLQRTIMPGLDRRAVAPPSPAAGPGQPGAVTETP